METVLGKFNNVVNNLGNKIALKEEGRELSYKDLDIQSTKIANTLMDKGIKKGDFVSLYLRRSVDTVISILGIIKAGGVYIPLDPSHPVDRTNYIIKDSGSNFVISSKDLLKNISNLDMSEKINLLLIEDIKQSTLDSNYEFNDATNDLMYVIYTSGTTGNPKGTLIRQKGVINLVNHLTDDWDIVEKDIILQFATYSFDASIVDTFCSLLNGCTLYLINDEERMSEENFLNIIDKEHISVIPVIPTVFFNRVVNFANDNSITSFNEVRIIGVGGELLLGDLARKFKSTIGKNTRFFNLYGPTEITVAASYYEVPSDLNNEVFSVPIGKALSGTKLYIVNEEGKLCEKGETGELCIASVGISLGYLNNEVKTNEVFVDNPFDNDIFEGKIYKSGDLVKELSDGNLEFVSRKDTQVKIRGHRIEIAEIETRMNEISEINDAVVAVEEVDGEKSLKAFFTSDIELDFNYIVEYLKENLPSYMIPGKMKQIEDIPFSPTGKADRKQLEKLDADIVLMISDNIVEPRNEVEKNILEAWKNVLGLDSIGVTDDFFDIGGHSLKIIAILAQLKQTYKTLSIKDFFDLKTVEKLSEKAINDSNLIEETFKNEFVKLTEYPKMSVNGLLPNVDTVLVTGSTGFLGSHIANKLVEEGKRVVLLVRGEDAKERVASTMNYYFEKEVSSNIDVINGDLTKQYLGLSVDKFKELAFNINAIIHSAADVRHFGDREHFEKINVHGTKNVFELVDINPDIVFHHISTIGIPHDLLAEGKWDLLEGNNEIPESLSLESVYTDTKLEAEKWVLNKVKEGKQVFIYRMGNLVGRNSDGKFQSNIDANAFYRMMKLLILGNKAPKVQWLVDFMPIDFASEVVVKSVLTNEHSQRVYHLCHPNPIHFKEFVSLLNDLDLDIELVERDIYDSYVLSNEVSDEVKNLAVAQLDGDGANDSNAIYDSNNTMEVLGITHIPNIDKEYIKKLILHAMEVGFMKENVKVN